MSNFCPDCGKHIFGGIHTCSPRAAVSEVNELRLALTDARSALVRAASVFEAYGRHHLDKNLGECDEKAARNFDYGAECTIAVGKINKVLGTGNKMNKEST